MSDDIADAGDSPSQPSEPSEAASPLPELYLGATQSDDAEREESTTFAPHGRTWRPALNRWLMTLNPGRTQDEYAKAVHYFFETPGVPQNLTELSYDLLLAYRGALALRADRRRRSMPRRAATSSGRLRAGQPGSWATHTLPGMTSGQTSGQTSADADGPRVTPASLRVGPLSPATVNIRLTALRQFLCFVIDQDQQDQLAPLSTERVRSALRRLRNERRRPYQILSEDEWGEFLDAALHAGQVSSVPSIPSASVDDVTAIPGVAAPAITSTSPTITPATPAARHARGPWGMTRAEREQARQVSLSEAASTQADSSTLERTEYEGATMTHSPDGRTGARTAQRDHALISLALATGLRAIELSLLDVGDLVTERRRGQTEWWLSLPDEKTKGQRGGRALPLAPELVATLLAYIRATGRAWENPEHRASPLFLALARGRSARMEETGISARRAVAVPSGEPERRYRRLRPEQIRGVIHRVEAQWLAQRRADSDDPAQAAEARRISPHTLRHSAAIALLLGDETSERPPASVEHVRGWLGHFDIRTTQRYLAHIESRDQRRRFAIRPHATNPDAAPHDEGERGV